MKKSKFLLVFLVAIISLFILASCDDKVEPTKFKVEYSPGECGGDSQVFEYLPGEEFVVKENTFTFENHSFTGWLFEGTIYSAGNNFVMKNKKVVFVAQWEEIVSSKNPSFSEETYTIDKSSGEEVALELDLDGVELYYVNFDDELYPKSNYTYDEERQALVISAAAISMLSVGEHTLEVITNVELSKPLQCTLVVTQSVVTSFDTVTTKDYVSTVDDGISFDVTYNGTNITKLTLNDNVVSEEHYQKTADKIIIKKEFLDRFCDTMEFAMYLSNNDTYTFYVNTNVIFATDYDYNTIHDTTASNLGHNPLYQYYDNVSIVEGPEGFEGNVIKITPNTEEVTYDCNSYFTIKGPNVEAMWYELDLKANKYYNISFDYMTEGTSVGEFKFDVYSPSLVSISTNLLMGSENDGVIHHFNKTYNGSDLCYCMLVWAKFIGGGGSIYFDNIRIVELDVIPVISSGGDYEQEGDYSFGFNPNGYTYNVYIDTNKVNYTFDNNVITINQAIMNELSVGSHQITVKTSLSDFSFPFNVIEVTLNSEFKETTYTHHYLSATENPKLYGSFSEGLTLVSLKQKDKIYKGIFGDPWQFCHNDIVTNYASRATLHSGENDTGYIEIEKSLFDAFWGDTTLIFEFSNGVTTEVVISSPDVLVSTNYDETTTFGSNNGVLTSWTPFNWGCNATFEFIEHDGSNALRINSASGDTNMFTTKYYPTNFAGISEWFAIEVNEGDSYRITFDYVFSGVTEAKYFYYTGLDPSDYIYNAYTDTYDLAWQIADYHILVWNLIVDGEKHTFDSGWIRHNSTTPRISTVYFPGFAEGAATVIFDNYKIVRSSEITNPVSNLQEYSKASGENLTIDVTGHVVSKLMIDDQEIEFTVEGNNIVIASTVLAAITNETYLVTLYSDIGVFKGDLIIS